VSFPRLFSAVRVGSLTLANRLVHVATLNNLAQANRATDRSVAYYEARARGGVGMIVTEGIAVHPKAVPTGAVIAGFEPGAVEGWRRIADAVHRHDVPVLAQLWHLGRQQLWTPISAPWAPSEIADPHSLTVPHAMTRAEIREVVDGFATTARHAREAGFDGVELHGAGAAKHVGYGLRAVAGQRQALGTDGDQPRVVRTDGIRAAADYVLGAVHDYLRCGNRSGP
jgi:2,4-dienoyl-CoA reductase-like NADH-dependent reductase (Old Yellow Enzyme family)